MTASEQLSKHFSAIFFGGNWTERNFEKELSEVTWKQAIDQVQDFNTIATLTFHVGYFVSVIIPVLKGADLKGNDKESFEHPSIACEADWFALQMELLNNAKQAAELIEQLPDSKLQQAFGDPKFGNYYENLHGIIEHSHYHLGQIVLLKRLVAND